MDNATTPQEKGRMDAMESLVSTIRTVGSVCDHAIQLIDQHGKIRGSWMGEDSQNGTRYSCRHCGKFYGYQPNKTSQEAMHQAYLEQQRRLNCPGCGDSPFMG